MVQGPFMNLNIKGKASLLRQAFRKVCQLVLTRRDEDVDVCDAAMQNVCSKGGNA